MQNTVIHASTCKRISLTPHCDELFIDLSAPRLSVEYAKARSAIDADYNTNFKMNQPLAKNKRNQSKRNIIEAMGGKVSKKFLKDKDGNAIFNNNGKEKYQLIVTFPDHTVANL